MNSAGARCRDGAESSDSNEVGNETCPGQRSELWDRAELRATGCRSYAVVPLGLRGADRPVRWTWSQSL